MAGSPRLDSPLLPSFTRELSEPTSTLACITEQPQNQYRQHYQHTFLCSPTIPSISPKSNYQYTFLYSSNPTSSHSTIATAPESSPPPLQQNLPSCLSLPNLGEENEDNSDNWTEGWDIESVVEMGEVKLLKGYELPTIREDEFLYYPKGKEEFRSHWSDGENTGGMKLRGIKLARSGGGKGGFEKRVRKVFKKLYIY